MSLYSDAGNAIFKIIADKVFEFGRQKSDYRTACRKLCNQEIQAITKSNNSEATELSKVFEFNDETITQQGTFITVPDSIKSEVSQFIAKAIENGIIAKEGSQLLECINMPKAELAKCKESHGLLRGYATHNGKIVRQGKFIQANFPISLALLQINAMITGQYFMHIISSQLKLIDKRLKNIENNIYQTSYADLDSYNSYLDTKSKQVSFNESEISHLEEFITKINSIRTNYTIKLNAIEPISQGRILWIEDAAEKLYDSFQSSNVRTILEILFLADSIYAKAHALLYYMLIKSGDDNPTNLNIKLENCMNALQSLGTKEYAHKYHIIKMSTLTHFIILQEYHVKSAGKENKYISGKTKEILGYFEEVEMQHTKLNTTLKNNLVLKVDNGIPTEMWQIKYE